MHNIASVSALSLLPADPTHTVHNVTTVVAPVRDWDNLGIYLGVPQTKRDEIRSKYSTDEKKKEALIDYWLCCSPVASWGKLAGVLHFMEEKQSLQLVQRHLKKTSGMVVWIIIRHIWPQ